MKPVPNRFKHLLAERRQLLRELRDLAENPPPPVDPTEAFRQVFRDGLEDEPETQANLI